MIPPPPAPTLLSSRRREYSREGSAITGTAMASARAIVGAPEALFLGSRKHPDTEHFLRLRLKGTRGKDNADGLGAQVTATLPGGRVLVRESGYASGYLSTGSPIVHLGLGPATRIQKLAVRWPSGFVQDLGTVAPVDRTLTVDEARGFR